MRKFGLKAPHIISVSPDLDIFGILSSHSYQETRFLEALVLDRRLGCY